MQAREAIETTNADAGRSAQDSAAAPDLLRIENLRVAFTSHGHASEVVKGVSFRVPAGKTVALVGESGSGKSVISQAVMGLLPRNGHVTGGAIRFAPQGAAVLDLASLGRNSREMQQLRGGQIGMIFQEPMSSLSPVHTIGNQIDEALQLHQPVPRREARAKTEGMLGLVGFRNPSRAFDMYSFELSGGLRQRAMLAMALICRPALLIADEPTTALDVTIQAQVLTLMKQLQADFGMAILLITHDLGVVANVADEVVVIYHGEIMEAGSVEDIFRRPGHPYLQALLNASPHFDMQPGERLVALREAKQEITTRPQPLKEAAGANAPPLLKVGGLRKSFAIKNAGWFSRKAAARVVAVDSVSFEIRRGECLGLVGESGCGKTTVSKMLMRAVTPDRGSVIFDNGSGARDVLALQGNALRQFRPRMQMIFQDPVSSLSPRATVLGILREPLDIHHVGTSRERAERCAELMRLVGLDPRFLNRYPHSFSGGQRQRIGIARALALDPDLVICDEPVSALDVSVQAQVLNLLKDLQSGLGLTYLFISHNLAVVDYMADRIAVMARGRIVETAPRHKLFREPAHPYTRTLLKAVPFPDLDRKLDFTRLPQSAASDPGAWPAAFQDDTEGGLENIDLGEGHFVLARKTIDRRELAA